MDITVDITLKAFEAASKKWDWKKCLEPSTPSNKKHRTGEFWKPHLSASALSWIATNDCNVETKVCALGVGNSFYSPSNAQMLFGTKIHNSLMPRVQSAFSDMGIDMSLEERFSVSTPSSISIRGRVDGLIKGKLIIELKNRFPNSRYAVNEYEIIQASIYSMAFNLPVYLVIAQYGDTPTFDIRSISCSDARETLKKYEYIITAYSEIASSKPTPPIHKSDCKACPSKDRCLIKEARYLCPHCKRPVRVDDLYIVDRGKSMPIGLHDCGYAFLVKETKDKRVEISTIRISGDNLQRSSKW